jgi:23S rRNA (guanosine2251-2'-O)-methyltransferase
VRETLYGRNAVFESLQAGRRQFYLLRMADSVRASDRTDSILRLASEKGTPIERVPRRELDWLGEINHQGVVLEASEYPYCDLADLLTEADQRKQPPFLLLLDQLQDPQNVGGLLRTAEAVGVHGAVIQRRRAASITPTVVHTSAGATEHLRIAQVENLSQTIAWLKSSEVWIAGLEATRGAQPYDQADLSGPLAIVVGSEGKGLRRLVLKNCDFVLQLPMEGKVTTLNAAVAGSIVLYEALRQRTAAT